MPADGEQCVGPHLPYGALVNRLRILIPARTEVMGDDLLDCSAQRRGSDRIETSTERYHAGLIFTPREIALFKLARLPLFKS